MSFGRLVVPSLREALGIPSTRIPIDVTTLVSYVLPPVVCYFVVAVLAVTPHTRAVRIGLWPIVSLLAFRAALSVDMSLGKTERKFLNVDMVASVYRHYTSSKVPRLTRTSLQLSMCSVATRTLDWTLAKEPLVRRLRPTNSSPSTMMDIFDLVSNLRGHGWEWSRGLYIPRETRPVNRIAFAFCTLLSAVVHALICGGFHRAVLSFAPVGIGSIPDGSSIFDETLPFLVRYFRASIITTCTAFAIYSSLQMAYDLCTIPAVLFLGQDPAQWPPAFDAPWRATSLGDFWGRRWHQWFRHTFLLGGYPLSFVLGRTGIVFGAFLSSAVFHQIAMWALGNRVEFWNMLVGFGMMAPGIVAERAFYEMTGRRVGGVAGWIWTMSWLLLWGNVMIEGFARAGMFGCSSSIDSALPGASSGGAVGDRF
ncbi:hypothetical protein J3R82DRAFT_6201 [Butyriboletus roseoflavus]|nr:hypothetical protein J3R82DRAFT_6201 [Butyriboletus roseoflavus]